MDIVEWDDEKMGIGIKLIDDQHKELLKIINLLSNSINSNSQKKDILTIVDKLIDYAGYHFSQEKELFDKFNYEETQAHETEHAKFLKKFVEIQKKLLDNESYKNESIIEISEDVFKYIIDWFINHVTGTDRKYVSLFKENGIE